VRHETEMKRLRSEEKRSRGERLKSEREREKREREKEWVHVLERELSEGERSLPIGPIHSRVLCRPTRQVTDVQ
jgi:hypothetical protein